MFCPNCGSQIPDDCVFCDNCGINIADGSGGMQDFEMEPSGSRNASKLPTITLIIAAIVCATALVVGGIIAFQRIGKKDTEAQSKTEWDEGDTTETEWNEEDEGDTAEKDWNEEDEENTSEMDDGFNEDKSDWLSEHSITLSPGNEFSFHTMMNDKIQDTSEVLVNGTINVTESEAVSYSGYKEVICNFVYDLSNADEAGVLEDGAFDRYTGIQFCTEKEYQEMLAEKHPAEYENFVRIENGEDYFDVNVTTELDVDFPTMTKKMSIICPEDYDGIIFYTGYDSLALEEEDKELEKINDLRSFDETAFYNNGHEYVFFSYK